MTTAQTPRTATKVTLRTTHKGLVAERTTHHAYTFAVWGARPDAECERYGWPKGPGAMRWSTSRALADAFANTLRGWGFEGVTVEPVTHQDGSPVVAVPRPRKARGPVRRRRV